jgi:hypothetical protein
MHESSSSIQCPYCSSSFDTADLVLSHSIKKHPGRAITAKLLEMGHRV